MRRDFHRARKQHRCNGAAHCFILPGEQYEKITVFPWTTVIDDVDDEGRPSGSPAGQFITERYCVEHSAERH